MELTIEEINVLVEAIDEWKSASSKNAMVISILAMGMMEDKEEARNYVDGKQREAEQSSKDKEEICILLKAKLIYIRRAIEKANFISEAREVIA